MTLDKQSLGKSSAAANNKITISLTDDELEVLRVFLQLEDWTLEGVARHYLLHGLSADVHRLNPSGDKRELLQKLGYA
jgi:hypothetical protein